MGKRQIERGSRAEGGPFAYVIDLAAQHDAPTAVELLRTFRTAGIEIHRADRPFTAGGKQYAAGSYVIPPQAFRPFVVDLMEPKTYPDRRLYPGGPPEPPYDMTGYELRFQLGVSVDRVMEPFEMPGPAQPEIAAAQGGVIGTGSFGHLLSPNTNASFRAVNQLLAEGAAIARAQAAFDAAGRTWPAGTFMIRNAQAGLLRSLAAGQGIEFVAFNASPSVETRSVRAPRIGLYRSWMAPMPEGWTRWVLDGYDFAWQNLTDSDIRGGDLSRFDIIVLPDQGEAGILNGHLAGTMPADFTGGLGVEGALALKRYVEAGGWVLAFDQAVDFAIDQFGLPVRNAVRGLSDEEFFIPGSLIRVEIDPSNPLAYGMARDAVALFSGSQVLQAIPAASEGERRITRDLAVYGRYAARDFLLSGWTLGGDRHLAGQPAAMRVPLGQGQVVLLAFTPHFRGQPRNTYKLLFNPLLEAARGTATDTEARR
jgi:hypothetical protein